MKRALALLLAGLALAPSSAAAAERSLLVNTSISRHAHEGDDVMRRYGNRLPRVTHVSLGTNDDPGDVDGFREAIYRGYNRALADEASRRDNLRVLNWVRMVRAHPEWLADDGVHVSAAGYRARANAVAHIVRRCE